MLLPRASTPPLSCPVRGRAKLASRRSCVASWRKRALSTGVLERWFGGKVGFTVRIPRVPASRLLGARLCNVGGQKIPLASYDRQGRRMSLFAMGPATSDADEGCQEGVRGFTLCRRAAAGIEYMLVSDYPQAEAKQLLIAALSPQDSR